MARKSKQKPEDESPVGDSDQLDIVGKRKDGGVDLLLIVGRPLDLSKATRTLFATKVRGYCQYVMSREFEDEFGAPSEDRVCIALCSDWEVPDELMQLMLQIASEEGVPAELAVVYDTEEFAERKVGTERRRRKR